MIVYKTPGISMFDVALFMEDVPVIPVNCFGIMGAGVARAARDRWPDASTRYTQRCLEGGFKPGDVHCFWDKDDSRPIYFAATKYRWQNPSRIEWVESCLEKLRERLMGETVLHLPALGCGRGGLRWEDVKPLIDYYLTDTYNLVMVYEPYVGVRRLDAEA